MVAAPTEGAARAREVRVLGYRVRVAPWLLERVGEVVAREAPAHTVAVITDEQVGPLHAAAVVGSLHHFVPRSRTIVRAIPAGEQHKTRAQWEALSDWMLGERCGRDTTVVALGGGVVGDLAGFVAATYMRGVPVVQCPTSLLAMVDASVGGKVGVDTPLGKNLIGAFHQPHAVVVDPTVLQTLPVAHRRAGLAEVIKHGIIADAHYLSAAVALGPSLIDGSTIAWNGDALAALIERSIAIKADVVREDETEGARRQVLNFGHTIGHAFEAERGFTVLHGEAIAVGMALEGALAERVGIAEAGTHGAIVEALRALGFDTKLPHEVSIDALMDLMRGDKKARAGELRFALPARPGAMATRDGMFGIPVPTQTVRTLLEDNP